MRAVDTPELAAAAGAEARQAAASDRKYLLERVDEAAVAQLYADGFEGLPLDRRP